MQVSGTCTLREAFQSVNNQSAAPGCAFTNQSPPSGCTYPGGSDLIIVPSGTYTVPTLADPANVRNEPIELNRNAWVCGNGVGTTILRGNSPTSSFFLRVVNNDPNWDTSKPVPAVTFEQMTVDHTSGYAFMTGIYSYISDVKVLKARVAGFGSRAIWGDDSNFRIEDSTIENNSSFFEGGAVALYNPMGHDRATTLNIQRSTLTNNVSATSGGALYLACFGATDLVNVTISGNRALDGGGIFKEPWSSYLLVWHTTVTNNTATNNGGGIAIFPEDQTLQGVQLTASIVADNSAPTGPDVRGIVSQFRDSLIGDDSGADTCTGYGRDWNRQRMGQPRSRAARPRRPLPHEGPSSPPWQSGARRGHVPPFRRARRERRSEAGQPAAIRRVERICSRHGRSRVDPSRNGLANGVSERDTRGRDGLAVQQRMGDQPPGQRCE